MDKITVTLRTTTQYTYIKHLKIEAHEKSYVKKNIR